VDERIEAERRLEKTAVAQQTAVRSTAAVVHMAAADNSTAAAAAVAVGLVAVGMRAESLKGQTAADIGTECQCSVPMDLASHCPEFLHAVLCSISENEAKVPKQDLPR
jgi:hypothetical protein